MTECRPRRAGGLLRARKKSHTPAAGAGLPAGGPGKGSSRCGWWCAHMKGYYERAKKKKPVDRAGALIYGRLYQLPCSTDFSMGRGRFLQLLSMSLSPCRPYHPAEVT